MVSKVYVFLIIVFIAACVEPYHLDSTAATNMLVVEAVFSNQLKNHQVLLSRATSLDERKVVREQGAVVTIADQHGNVIDLSEKSPGVYETPVCGAQAGGVYTLHIETLDGKIYASREVPFKDGADIGEVYPKYVNKDDEENKGLQIHVDTEDPTNQTHFYRWNYIETYEIQTPFPSSWIWLGGNDVEFREERIDICYVSDTSRNIIVRNTKGLEQDKVVGQAVRFIPADSYITRNKYSILVQQFCLSDESYLYWENLRMTTEQQGSLSDIQPGSMPGNLFSVTHTSETVLGYFDACKVSEKRIFFSATDFYDEGFVMPTNLRSQCYDITPIEVQDEDLGTTMAKYEKQMYIWEVSGFSPFTVFYLLPKYCCDCREFGPTERPAFFD